jgi:Rrf2 family protein
MEQSRFACMFVYGKTAANAVAIMSYLAASPTGRGGSAEIARTRRISPALTAKLLTRLAAAGLVKGQPGPGGGYALNKPAQAITLLEIVSLFERIEAPEVCPFGAGWCGHGEPCPLHDKIHAILGRNEDFLKKTRLSVFTSRARARALPQPHLTALQRKFAHRAKARKSSSSTLT